MVREGCEESGEEAEEDGAAGRAGESCHHPELQHQVCHHPQVQLAAGVSQVQLGPSLLGGCSISCLCEVRVTRQRSGFGCCRSQPSLVLVGAVLSHWW